MNRITKLYLLLLIFMICLSAVSIPAMIKHLLYSESRVSGIILISGYTAVTVLMFIFTIRHFIICRRNEYIHISRLVPAGREIRNLLKKTRTHRNLIHAISKDYDCIYVVDTVTDKYEAICFSSKYRFLGFDESGDDFFLMTVSSINNYICGPDYDEAMGAFKKENILKELEKHDSYTFSSSLVLFGELIYYEVRVLKSPIKENTIMVTSRNITEQIRRETEIQKQEKQLEMLELQHRNSRIKNSVSQMQPHFLYNTLGSIREIVLYDPEYASELIYDFTTHLRACVRTLYSDELIMFSQEMENVRAYVRIEQMRFGEKLKVIYDLDDTDFKICPLSVQPIVENAIQHGIHGKGREGGSVIIRTRSLPDCWKIQIIDNGIGFDVEKTMKEIESSGRDSTGISNITFRLKRIMHAQVNIRSTIGKGTSISVLIPKNDIQGVSIYTPIEDIPPENYLD